MIATFVAFLAQYGGGGGGGTGGGGGGASYGAGYWVVVVIVALAIIAGAAWLISRWRKRRTSMGHRRTNEPHDLGHSA